MKIKVKGHKRRDGTKVKGHVRHTKSHSHSGRTKGGLHQRHLLGNHRQRRRLKKDMNRLIEDGHAK